MGGGAGVGFVQTAETRDAPGQLQNAAVVDVIQHGCFRPFPGRAGNRLFWHPIGLYMAFEPAQKALRAGLVMARPSFGRAMHMGMRRSGARRARHRPGALATRPPGDTSGARLDPRRWSNGEIDGRHRQALAQGPTHEHVHKAPQPVSPRPSREEAEAAVRTLIAYIGDNPKREGLLDTPKRVVGAYEELYRGYRESAGGRAGAHVLRDRRRTTISCWCATSPSTPPASTT